MAAAVSWPLLRAVRLAKNAPLEAEAPVRVWEEELDERKARSVHTLLAAGLADKMGTGVPGASNPWALPEMCGTNWPTSGLPTRMA